MRLHFYPKIIYDLKLETEMRILIREDNREKEREKEKKEKTVFNRVEWLLAKVFSNC